MSVRIYHIAKQIDMENKELLDLLQERGFAVSSVSSAIDNISAEAIIEEFTSQEPDGEKQRSETESPAAQATAPSEPKSEAVKTGHPTPPSGPTKATQAPAPPPPAPGKRPAAPPPPPPSGKVRPTPPPPAPPKAEPSASASSNPGTGTKIPGIKPPPAERPPAPPPIRTAGGSAGPGSVKRPSTPQGPPRPPSGPPRPPGHVAPPPPAKGSGPAVTVAPRPPSQPTTPSIPKRPESASPAATPASDRPRSTISVKPPIVVKDFATSLKLKPFQLISELMEMGIFAALNQTIEEDVARRIANRQGYDLEIRHRGESDAAGKKEVAADVQEKLEPRPPVCCILGHVDHGKTTLLDSLRKTRVTEGEFGGITQHLGAYQIEHNGQTISFLDTPGHSAFSAMRERGAGITDIAILVVAADDGFMPQTDEALKYAKRSQAALVVAINKIDAKGANIDRVKTQMQERGIAPEDWGGETITVPISALKGENLDQLLEMILLQSEIMELMAPVKGPASGVILESEIEQGRGPTASILVQKGTLKVGDALVCGTTSCKIKAIMNDRGERLKSAGPSAAVRIIGWSEAPAAGARFESVKNEREAKRLAAEELDQLRSEEDALQREAKAKGGLEALFGAIEESRKSTLGIILKTDVRGSLEAIRGELNSIESDKVGLRIINAGIGPITKKDVEIAATSGATIVGFNVRPEPGVQGLAKHHAIEIYSDTIIYELIDTVRDRMAELLEPEIREQKLGAAEVRAVFPLGKRKVAGCMVTEGKLKRDTLARLFRKGEVVHESRIATLKRFKDDATEVRAGYECGCSIEGYHEYAEGDTIECYEIVKVRPSL